MPCQGINKHMLLLYLNHFCSFLSKVDLYGESNVVSGVITQGAPDSDEWVQSFKVKTGTQLCNLQYVVGSDNNPMVSVTNKQFLTCCDI